MRGSNLARGEPGSLLAGYRMKRIFGQATDAEMKAMLDSDLVRRLASFLSSIWRLYPRAGSK